MHRENAQEHTGSAETLRPSLRNGFTAYSALSPATGFVATVIPEKRLLLTNLTPASGRQDHTISPYAIGSVRLTQLSRPPHPPARFVTCATPLSSGETGGVKPVICPTPEGGIFLREGLDRFFLICPSGCYVAPISPHCYCERSDAIHSAARLSGCGLLLGR